MWTIDQKFVGSIPNTPTLLFMSRMDLSSVVEALLASLTFLYINSPLFRHHRLLHHSMNASWSCTLMMMMDGKQAEVREGHMTDDKQSSHQVSLEQS